MQGFPDKRVPADTTFIRLEKETWDYVDYFRNLKKHHDVTNEETEWAVLELVDQNSHTSQRAIARTEGISKTSVFNN